MCGRYDVADMLSRVQYDEGERDISERADTDTLMDGCSAAAVTPQKLHIKKMYQLHTARKESVSKTALVMRWPMMLYTLFVACMIFLVILELFGNNPQHTSTMILEALLMLGLWFYVMLEAAALDRSHTNLINQILRLSPSQIQGDAAQYVMRVR